VKNSASFKRNSRASRVRKRFLLLLGGLVAIGAVAFMFFTRQTPVGLVPAHHALRPHARPTPIAQWDAQDLQHLRADLSNAFAAALAGADGWSFAVLAPDGKLLYDDRANSAVIPASAQKLIVAASAIATLEPGFRYRTLLTSSSPVGDDGRLDGDLALVGSGDPSFRRDDLSKGVVALVRGGLQRVAGGALVDAHAISGPEINPLWNANDVDEDYEAPTSGVSVDQDTVEVHVIGTVPGQPAQIKFLPPSDVVHFAGSVTSSGNGSDDVTVKSVNGSNDFAVSGVIPAGTEEKFWISIHNVPAYAGSVLDRMLRDAGVSVGSPPRVGEAPLDWVTLWEHRSQPIRALVRRMLFDSNNHFAEQILRTVGGVNGPSADDAAGLAAERRYMRERGIPTPGLHVVDGSGLAHANRVAAITLASLLLDAERRGGRYELYRLLPLGGRQGTLAEYDFTDALGRVRAKSGHLSNATALAGYVNTQHHGLIIFAFMLNGSPGDPDSAIVRAVDRLAAL
jgi:D-alanyl-D-alanine carboxypeptidase/D-alanyl-D-alanine-endopeptidase (penicillin-binding protein 4)